VSVPPAPPSETVRRGMGLRGRLLVLIALACLPLVLGAWYLAREEERNHYDTERERLVYVARELAEQHELAMAHASQSLTILAGDPAFASAGAAECGRRIAPLLRATGTRFAAIWVREVNGSLRCAAGEEGLAGQPAKGDLDAAALASSGDVVGAPLRGAGASVAIPMVRALRDSRGEALGTLAVAVDLAHVAREIGDAKLGADARIGIVDDGGRVLLRVPDPEGVARADAPPHPAAGEAGKVTEPGVSMIPIAGIPRLIAYAPLQAYRGGRLVLFVSQPDEVIAAKARNRYLVVFVGGGAAIAIALVLLWWGTERLLVAPVSTLAQAARRLGRGDLAVRSGLGRAPGEMGGLARSFDAMAESLGAMADTVRTNRALRVLAAGRRLRIDEADEAEAMDAACRALVEDGGYRAAWVGFVIDDEPGTVEAVACAGGPIEFFRTMGPSWKPGPRGEGAVGRAVREKRTVYVGDYRADDGLAPWREAAGRYGVNSVLAMPLLVGDRVVATLTVYATEADAFRETEAQLLEEIAADLSRAMTIRREHSGRVHAEQALEASQRQLVEGQRLAHVGTWDVDLATREVRASDELLRIYEFDPSAGPLPMAEFMARVHEEDRDGVIAEFEQAVAERRMLDATYRLVFPDGRSKVVQASGEVTLDAEDRPAHLTGALQDVTAAYGLRVALRERMKELRCLHDVFRATEDVSQPLGSILERVAGSLPVAFLHEDIACARVRYGHAVFHTPGFRETEWHLRVPFEADGESGEVAVAYLEARSPQEEGPFFADERVLLEAVARRLAETIERRADNLHARERETIYAAVVDKARDSIGVIDPVTGRLVEFNDAAAANLGYTRAEFEGIAIASFDANDGQVEVLETLALMQQPGGHTIERRHRHKDGTLRDVRVSARAIEVGGRPFVAAIWSDITDERRARAEADRANRQVHAIAEATKAIVFARQEDELLASVCRAIASSGGYVGAWVGYARDDARRSIAVRAHSGLREAYARSLDATWGDGALGDGPSGRSIRTSRPAVVRHVPSDPSVLPWRDAVMREGIGSVAAFPLSFGEAGPHATLVVYAAVEDAFDDAEMRHIEGLADTLAFGVRALRDRASRDAARARAVSTAARLEHLLRASPVVVYSLRETEGVLVPSDVSENVTRLLGCTREEALGAAWWSENVHPGERPQALAARADVLQAGTVSHDYRFRHAAGRWVWLRDELRAERDVDGRVVEIVGAWTDVTAEKETEAQVRRLSAVVEQSPTSVVITDLEGRIEYVNEAFTRTTGYGFEDVRGRNPRILQSGRTPRETYEAMWATLVAGHIWRGEFMNLRKDGTLQVEDAIVVPLRGAGGLVTHYVAIKEDVTEKKRVADELRKLYLAVEQSPESIAISDLDARIEYVNEAFVRHSGYTREEVIGRNPRVLQSGLTPPETYAAMWRALRHGRPWKGEFVNRRKDGSTFVEMAIIAPVRQPDGTITHYLAIKDDITDKKRMGEELDRHRHHLEDLVASRTAELAEARARAEAANVAKSAFLANMSHEIRTPMNAILGLARLLQSTPLSAEQADRLAKIEASGHHLLSLVNDILDLSKVESGHLALERADFDLATVVREAWEPVSLKAAEKGVESRLRFGDGLPARVRGDALRLAQVILNLGSNAVKFTETGYVEIAVAVRESGPSGWDVRFDVRDTGVGIAPDQQERIFQPFEQADASTTRKFGGTGLGLAICRRLVDAMGGELGVESVPAEGSTFWFHLPLAAPGGEAASGEEAAQAEFPVASRAPADVRVLLVEDDPINREVAGDMLRLAGFPVAMAIHGAAAVEMAARERFAVILMDVQMPVMDGFEATRRIRALPGGEAVPVIAMTANVFSEDRDRAREAGMSDFVAKPVDPEALFRALRRWTGAAASLPQARSGPTSADEILREALARVEGLDLEAGLKSVQGRWSGYERLLRQFADERAGDARSLRACLVARDDKEATRRAHTLKGVAATLGAKAVAGAAGRLERLLAESVGDPAVREAALAELESTLAAFVGALRRSLPERREAGATVDAARAKALVDELAALLATDDVRAARLFEERGAQMRAALGPAAAAVEKRVASFDFEGALDALRLVFPAD